MDLVFNLVFCLVGWGVLFFVDLGLVVLVVLVQGVVVVVAVVGNWCGIIDFWGFSGLKCV